MDKNKQFPGKMDKTTERKYKQTYFVGNKKLKHVKLFENFDKINEAVKGTATIKGEEEKERVFNATKKFMAQVEELHREIKEYNDLMKLMDVMKEKSKRINVLKEQLLPGLQRINATNVRLEDFVINVKENVKTKGERITYSYKEISEALEALIPVTEKTKKQIESIRELNKKVNPSEVIKSYDLHISKLDEGVVDWVKSIFGKLATTFKKMWDKIAGNTDSLNDSIDKLADKVAPLGAKIPSEEAAMKKIA